MDFASYIIILLLYGFSLEMVYAVSKRGAWIFMLIVTMAIMMSYPNFAQEIAYFTSGARRTANKGKDKKK